jgi:phosphohistidine phosphatase
VRICLVRHAIAVERGSGGYGDDRARPLTPEGRKRMAEAAKGLASLLTPEAIHTSPVLRARQTAEILTRAWRAPVFELEALGRGDHAGTLAALNAAGNETSAAVGHEPWMSELLSYLVSGEPDVVATSFKKGGAALIDCGDRLVPGTGMLIWFMPPAALRRLA